MEISVNLPMVSTSINTKSKTTLLSSLQHRHIDSIRISVILRQTQSCHSMSRKSTPTHDKVKRNLGTMIYFYG